jgi:hypothetical protein
MKAEPCDTCECSLSEPDSETKTVELPSDMDFQRDVRDYVLEKGKLDDESVFIDRVTICPSSVEVEYSTRLD